MNIKQIKNNNFQLIFNLFCLMMQDNLTKQQDPLSFQLERILNPSQSKEQLLQQQFQSRINSIQQSLTAKSNFLFLFQQMLEKELKQHPCNQLEFKQNQSNQFNQLSHQISLENIPKNCKIQNYIQENMSNIQKRCFLVNEKTNQLQKSQLLKNQQGNQIVNLYPQKKNKAIKNRQEQTIIGLNQKDKQQNSPFNQIKHSPQQQANESDQQSENKINMIKFIRSKLIKLHQKVQEIASQNQKFKLFAQNYFTFSKNFFIHQIFKTNLQNIVESIQKKYELKYQQYQLKYQQKLKHQQKPIQFQQIFNINTCRQSIQQSQQKKKKQNTKKNILKELNINSKFEAIQNMPEKNFFNEQKTEDFVYGSKLNVNKIQSNGLGDILKLKDCNQKYRKGESFISEVQNAESFTQISKNNYSVRKINDESSKNSVEIHQRLIQRLLKKINFEIKIPSLQSLIGITSTKSQPQFKVVITEQMVFKGYVENNKFVKQGKLQLKSQNLLYEGQFKNHKLNGKGKLILNLQRQKRKLKHVQKNENQKITKMLQNLVLVIVAEFYDNKINGYSKIILMANGSMVDQILAFWENSLIKKIF